MTGRAGLRVVGRWARQSLTASCWVVAPFFVTALASAFLPMPLHPRVPLSIPPSPSVPALNATPPAPAPTKTKTEEKLIEFAPWEEVPA